MAKRGERRGKRRGKRRGGKRRGKRCESNWVGRGGGAIQSPGSQQRRA